MTTELGRLDAVAQASLVRNREVTPTELVEHAIARIEALDPQFNAVVTTAFDEGLDTARTLAADDDTPFAGVPILLKDLVTDRGAFDRIIQAGGFVSVNTGGTPDANALPIGKSDSDRSMDAAACIGCGACVAACPNGSASLFTAAKISHLGLLPQGQPERYRRATRMVAQMDEEGFGHCTLYGECQDACPKEISIDTIARMNRDFEVAALSTKEEKVLGGTG